MTKYVAFMNPDGDCMGFTTRVQFERLHNMLLEPGDKGIEFNGTDYDQSLSEAEVDAQFQNLKRLAAEAVKNAARAK